jgi:hypothetical protein
MKDQPDWQQIEVTVDEIVAMQKKTLLSLGRRIIPTLTPEDMLQPNDYPDLESHPEFRYEEGLLAGVQTVQTALRTLARCLVNPSK